MGGRVDFDLDCAWMVLEASQEPSSWACLLGRDLVASGEVRGRSSVNLVADISKRMPTGFVPRVIGVGVGPGSFGGIRVSIAVAMGFRAVWGCDLFALRSVDGIAWRRKEVSFLGVFQDARRGQFFVTYYERGRLARETKVIEKYELDEHLGKCSLALSDGSLPEFEKATADAVAGAEVFMAFGREESLELEPIHLRPALNKTMGIFDKPARGGGRTPGQ